MGRWREVGGMGGIPDGLHPLWDPRRKGTLEAPSPGALEVGPTPQGRKWGASPRSTQA